MFPRTPITFYMLIFGLSCLLSLLLTPAARKLAIRWGRVAVPRDNRWHRKETALLGGVSIFASMIGIWVLGAASSDWSLFGQPHLVMILCAAGIFALGLFDDLVTMDPQHKLAGQVIVTAILIFFGYRLGCDRAVECRRTAFHLELTMASLDSVQRTYPLGVDRTRAVFRRVYPSRKSGFSSHLEFLFGRGRDLVVFLH